MKGIDRLREYVKDAPASSMGEMARAIVAGMADEIERDERSLRGFAERLETAASERADVTLFGVDYTALPLDADGEAIHVGDVMEWPYGNGEFRVNGIGGNTLFYIDKDSGECEWTAAGDKHHHHAPTVLDVLREFAEKVIDSQIPSVHPTYEEAIAEYAAKLRLAGDDV